MSDFTYVGTELELFSQAHNWKHYCARLMAPHLRGSVLEVGAGLGSFTLALCHDRVTHWLCLEPDARNARKLSTNLSAVHLKDHCCVQTGKIGDLPVAETERFDAILYLDVLEHIADDRAELARAATLLNPGGDLLVLAPAWPALHSPFDDAVGHHRRYTRETLLALTPPGMEQAEERYLDSAGCMASLANKLLLRQSEPSLAQIRFWDGVLVPISRWLDPLIRYHLGRSLLVRWTKSR